LEGEEREEEEGGRKVEEFRPAGLGWEQEGGRKRKEAAEE
jgi:hypothetical protein